MKFRWRLPSGTIPSAALLEATRGQRLVAEILAGRGITDPQEVRAYLDPESYRPTEAAELHDMEVGVARIEQALVHRQRILVWGDFDVDGQTATSLLVSALQKLDGNVSYHIPVRERESHGVRPDVLAEYLELGIDLLLTCDTGIDAVESAALARDHGVDVIITDHHDLPEELPSALALINPKFAQSASPLSGLPGVGVAFKLIEALFTRAGRSGELEEFLDLVALGIVADLADQREEARYLLQRGMQVLRMTNRPGLLALMENAQLEVTLLNEEQISFQLGPRLNAVGRLADANVTVPLLTTSDKAEARDIADQLEQLNEERKFETSVVYESARELISNQPSLLQYAALVVGHARWHPGVIGIVASRLVEDYGKPTILLSIPDGAVARGSARSIEGYHITAAIATQVELLLGFGGHPMAAGLSMKSEHLNEFRRGVSRAIIEQRKEGIPEAALDIDAVLPLADLTLDTASQLERMAPFGPGNPPINILCRGIHVEGDQQIGKDATHRKLAVTDGEGTQRELLWWNSVDEPLPEGAIDVVVRARPGYFRGEQSLTLTLQDLAATGWSPTDQLAANDFIDCRGAQSAAAKLREIRQIETDLQVWEEGIGGDGMLTRKQLKKGSALVIWTLPPDQQVLGAAIERVQPQRIYLFSVDPNLDEYEPFTRRLAGLVKYAMHHYQGRSTIDALAVALAQSASTACSGLEILPSLGVRAMVNGDGQVEFERCAAEPVEEAAVRLQFLLEETRAFRRMLSKAEKLETFF